MFLLPLLIIGCFANLSAEEYGRVISLGGQCQVAYQLKENHKRSESFPFDWIQSTFEGVYQFILEEGKNFLSKDHLVFAGNKGNYVQDPYYQMLFLHDFESPSDFMKEYDFIKAKYDRRVNRFFQALNSEAPVLLIRLGITREQAALLSELIHTKYPRLNYTILALDHTEEIRENWNIKRVINLYLLQEDPHNWLGDHEDWKRILSQFHIEQKDE